MKKSFWTLLPIYAITMLGMLMGGFLLQDAAEAFADNRVIDNKICFVIDAGHGGEDGGAVSCRGAYESNINLQIAQRLDDLMHLLGYKTVMIRRTDISIYTSGTTLAAKKASDLKERVRIVNETENAVLLSIHQNHFTDSFYKGAQMFYPETEGSRELAMQLQTGFVTTLNIGSERKIKKAEGLYLMKHIRTTGVLIECGFLSNYEEEANLKDPQYQKKICCVIATVCSNYANNKMIT